MERKVPLFIYDSGKRVQVGTANVQPDGVVTAQLDDLQLADYLGISVGPYYSIGWYPPAADHENLKEY